MNRRLTHLAHVICTVIASMTFIQTQAIAQTYPTKPVSLVVGFAPGGSADILARLLAQKLTTAFGQPVVVENKPGAGATIAAASVATAQADGYHLLLVTSGHAGSSALYPKLTYNPITSFAPVALVAATPVVIVAPTASPFKSLNDLVIAARKNPGKLNYSAGGGGATVTALAAEYLKSDAKLDMQQIPYKGSGPALTALLAGELDVGFDIPSSSLPHIQAGKLRALAVTSKTRSTSLPQIATVAEQGFANFEVIGWFGVIAPAGTPATIVARLNKEINAALALPDVKEKMLSLGLEPSHTPTPAEFAKLMAVDTQRAGDAIRRLGIKAD